MTSTNVIRDWWHLYRCSPGVLAPNGFFGRTPVFCQNVDHVAALEAAHIGAGYVPTKGGYMGSKRRCPAGIGGKKCQPDGTDCSLHNYCLAWDVEYNHNPHLHRRITETELTRLHAQGKTKYTNEIVAGILSVKNTHGERLFTWLGYNLGDLMHWQINVPPQRQDVDWTTIPGGGIPVPPDEGEGMYLPLKYSDGFASNPARREDVRWLQTALNRLGYDAGAVDGKYGNDTAAAVKRLVGGDGRTYNAEAHDKIMASGTSGPVAPHDHPVTLSGRTGKTG